MLYLARWIFKSLASLFCSYLVCLSVSAVEIEITGNKRTKEHYLHKLTRICVENREQELIDQYADVNFRNAEGARQLRKCLLNKADFLENIEIKDYNAQKIVLEVKEKWTFLGLPSYVQSEEAEDNSAGLLLYESNLVGIGHELGFLYNHGLDSSLDTFAFFYNLPFFDADGKFDLNFILWDRDSRTYNYAREQWIFRTREIFRFFWIRLKHHIDDNLSLLYGYAPASLRFSEGEFSNGTQITSSPATDLHSLNFAVEWKDTEPKYYYDSGTYLLATWHQQIKKNNKDPLESALLFELIHTLPTYKRHSLQVSANAGWRSHVKIDDHLRLGNSLGSRGIPAGGAWAKAYANIGLDYQMPITSGRYGYWTAGPFFDIGHLWDTPHIAASELTYTAAGVASYVQLLKVNIPAVGIFYSYNDHYQSDFFSFYVGFTL